MISLGRFAACVAVAGATKFTVGALFHVGIPLLSPGIPPQFENQHLFRPWGGWTRTYMAIHPFGFGLLFATVYLVLLGLGCVAPGWRDGSRYGFGVFLVGSLPVYMLVFAAFAVSPEVVTSWVAQSLCQYTAAGVAVGLAARRA